MDSKRAREIIEAGRKKLDQVVTAHDQIAACEDIVRYCDTDDWDAQIDLVDRWLRTFKGQAHE
jgi:hypothetical protein